MRVKGNIFPDTLIIEPYHPMPGYMEVRLRENVKEITETDSITGQEYTMFEYDEYTLHVKEKEGLYEEITANMDEWLITGRTLEVNAGASIVRDMEDALTLLGYPDSLEVSE